MAPQDFYVVIMVVMLMVWALRAVGLSWLLSITIAHLFALAALLLAAAAVATV